MSRRACLPACFELSLSRCLSVSFSSAPLCELECFWINGRIGRGLIVQSDKYCASSDCSHTGWPHATPIPPLFIVRGSCTSSVRPVRALALALHKSMWRALCHCVKEQGRVSNTLNLSIDEFGPFCVISHYNCPKVSRTSKYQSINRTDLLYQLLASDKDRSIMREEALHYCMPRTVCPTVY